MSFENLTAKPELLDQLKSDLSLDKSIEYKIDTIRDNVEQYVISQTDNFNLDISVTSFDKLESNKEFTTDNFSDHISTSIQDNFKVEDSSWFKGTMENYSTQVNDWQHSGNRANTSIQIDQYFENGSSFNTRSKWSQPGGKGSSIDISYSFSNLLNGGLNGISAEQAEAAIEEAFDVWSDYAPLNFNEVEDSSNVQIRIGYDYIDGPSNTLAFAYFPTNGDITFDSGDRWSTSLFLETAVHEIGHSLGLDHESGTGAIMNPTIQGRYNGLGSAFLLQDDINGIRSLYGNGRGSVNPLDSTPPVDPNPTPTPSGPRKINGTFGNDVLMGNDRDNRIRGFAGDDYLEGGKGDDNIKGGKGADTFSFKSLDGSVDTIKDFSLAEGDVIEVSGSGFGASSSDDFTYDVNSGGLFLGNQQFAILENKPSLSNVDAGFKVT